MPKSKVTTKEQAQILLSEGTVKKVIGFQNPTYIVESHGHTYRIENSFSNKPKITQVDSKK